MRPEALIVTEIFVLILSSFLLFSSPVFAAEVLVLGKTAAENTIGARQCDEKTVDKGNPLVCVYNPAEQRCLKQRQEEDARTLEELLFALAHPVAPVREQKTAWKNFPVPEGVENVPVRRPAIIGAPMPYIYKTENGRRVCGSKSDHPHKSKKGKGIHMDMECCLDPDEYPNPHCYYPPEKYGKYLNRHPR